MTIVDLGVVSPTIYIREVECFYTLPCGCHYLILSILFSIILEHNFGVGNIVHVLLQLKFMEVHDKSWVVISWENLSKLKTFSV